METIPENCIYYRSNITGTFKATKQSENNYTVSYEPSGMFEGRGLKPQTLKNCTLETIDRKCDILKGYIIAMYNFRK